MHTLKESAAGAVLAGGAAFLLWVSISGEPGAAVRVALMIGALPLVIGALVQHTVTLHSGRARVERFYNSRQVIEPRPVELPRGRGAGEIVEPERVRLIPVMRPASTVMASAAAAAPASVLSDDGRETARVVSVEKPARLIDGCNEKDLLHFVERLELRGHSRSSWAGQVMPSGRRVDSTYHAALVSCLEKIGAIEGRAKGSAGRVVLRPAVIVERLGLPVEAVEPA